MRPSSPTDVASRAVRKAIQEGRLVRSAICEECGCSDRIVEAAHADYGRPLEVRWLCRSCHRRWDRIDPKGGVAVGTATIRFPESLRTRAIAVGKAEDRTFASLVIYALRRYVAEAEKKETASDG